MLLDVPFIEALKYDFIMLFRSMTHQEKMSGLHLALFIVGVIVFVVFIYNNGKDVE